MAVQIVLAIMPADSSAEHWTASTASSQNDSMEESVHYYHLTVHLPTAALLKQTTTVTTGMTY